MFYLAKELGMTVSQLQEHLTEQEMLLWSGYFGYTNDKQAEQQRKAQRRRR